MRAYPFSSQPRRKNFEGAREPLFVHRPPHALQDPTETYGSSVPGYSGHHETTFFFLTRAVPRPVHLMVGARPNVTIRCPADA